MFFALVIVGVGAALVGSALTGNSLADWIAGDFGNLNPKGGRGGNTDGGGGANLPAGSGADSVKGGSDPKGEFKGPNAAFLRHMAQNATRNFNLRITDTCRPANAGYGSQTSFHIQCRALDVAGSASDMMAFAKWAKPQVDRLGGGAEIFYDPAGWKAPGFSHSDHVHVGA